MTEPASTLKVLDTFLAAFGDEQATARADVRSEIHAYWRAGGSLNPMAVYDHLIQKRMVACKISPERADFLKRYFAESFTPESTTGYYHKHREPLVEALVEEYAKAMPSSPIYRIEADIMNLGGLNALLDGDKALADSVIRLMAGMLKEKLDGKEITGSQSDVCAIRHGGDELLLFVRPKDTNITQERITKALEEVQKEIAIFIAAAHLANVPHKKEGRLPGIGIGCAAVRVIPNETKLQRHQKLEDGIEKAKTAFLEELGVADNPPPEMEKIKSLFERSDYAIYRHAKPHPTKLRAGDSVHTGASPELARFERMKRQFDALPSANASIEAAALKQLHALTEHRDPVTGRHMFGDMQTEILPNFKAELAKGGTNAQLVHIDFNNLGGGNALGYWVGNAMSKQFTQSIEAAMKEVGLKTFLPYLTSQDACRFALLLPSGISPQKISQLHSAVEMQLHQRWNANLLDTEELAASHQKMKGKAEKYPAHVSADTLSSLAMGDVVSGKAVAFKGSHVMYAVERIVLDNPELVKAIKNLEETVEQRHKTKDNRIERGRNAKVGVSVDGGTHVRVTSKATGHVRAIERAKSNEGQVPTR